MNKSSINGAAAHIFDDDRCETDPESRRVPTIDVPPPALWKRVLRERREGATWPEIEEMSPDFPEWKQAGEETLKLFPGRRLSSATLQDWDVRRSIQLRREAAESSRWSLEMAAHSARESFPDLETAVEGALRDLAFNLLRLAMAQCDNARLQVQAVSAFDKLARWIDRKDRRADLAERRIKQAEERAERRQTRQQTTESKMRTAEPRSVERQPVQTCPVEVHPPEVGFSEVGFRTPEHPPHAQPSKDSQPSIEAKDQNQTDNIADANAAVEILAPRPVQTSAFPPAPVSSSKPNAGAAPQLTGNRKQRRRAAALMKKEEKKAADDAARLKRLQDALGKDHNPSAPTGAGEAEKP